MKTILKYTLLTTFLLSALVSCRDEDVIRMPSFENGPNWRMQLIPEFSYFDFDNINTAKLVYDVFSENANEIGNVVVKFRYQRNGAPSCANRGCLGPFEVKTYTGDQVAAAGGVLRGEAITVQQVAALVGIDVADISGGDQFFFTVELTMKDGRSYPGTVNPNTGQDPTPGIFDQPGSSFTTNFAAIVGCPVAKPFTGSYKMEQLEGNANWNGGAADSKIFATGNVTISLENPITRKITLINFLGFANREMLFIMLCDNMIVPAQTSGLACSGNAVQWTSTHPNVVPAVYDPNDDSEFYIHIFENPTTACGVAGAYTVLKFTKN